MTRRTEPRLDCLCYRLYERPMHPELFDLRGQKRFTPNGFEASVWLADQGHVIAVHHEELTLTEVFIDPACDLPLRGRLEGWYPQGEKDVDRLYCGRIRYRMACQVEVMRPKVYATMHKDTLAKGQTRGLCATFPERISAEGVVPFSWLDFEITAHSLHVFATHALPGELTMLKVQTLIDLP